MEKYALIENGTVVNVILWDGVTPWDPPEGQTAVALAETGAWLGWTYDGTNFSPPPQDPVE